MEITTPRWIAATVACCALAWIGITHLPGPIPLPAIGNDGPLGTWNPVRRPSEILEEQLAEENDRLRFLELRDSIAPLGSAAPGAFTVLVDRSVSDSVRRETEVALHDRWRAFEVTSPLPVVVALVMDTPALVHGLPRARHYTMGMPIDVFLPSPETGGRCIALGHPYYPISSRGEEFISADVTSALLNPCGLYAAFGAPGPEISAWLRRRGWAPARLAAWSDQPQTSIKRTVSRLEQEYADRAPISFSADPSLFLRRYVPTLALACISGQRGSCSRAALGADTAADTDTAWTNHIVRSSGGSRYNLYNPYYFPNNRNKLGPAEAWLVSDIVRKLGPTRFARFWTSSLPVDSAFHAASGQTLDAWVHEWSINQYGGAYVGPGTSVASLVTGVVIAAIALAIALQVGKRRRVA